MKRYLPLFLLVFLFGLAACSNKEPQISAVEGREAPDFTLPDLAGKQARLSDLRGNVVMVNFWATWCPPCREEVPSLVALNRLMAGKPFRMMAISVDTGGKQAVEEYFAASKNILPAFLDSDGKTGRIYGITGVPETFVIDKRGVIIKKVIGPRDWSSPEMVKFLDDAMK
jgi:thiol-disulfide isomerase/thioredoxin